MSVPVQAVPLVSDIGTTREYIPFEIHIERNTDPFPSGAMAEYIGTGNTGRFAGLFATFVGAAFSYGGVETVTVAAGETAHPRRNIPRAVRRVFWRILFFYILGSLGVGVLVPYTQPELNKAKGANASPWVIAISNAGVKGLPSVINAVLVTSASSAANADLYNGSRYLYSLAQTGQAPKIFRKCTKSGIPIYAIGLTACFLPITYMSISAGPGTVFNYLANITTLGNIITWISVLVSYIRFRAGVKAQNVDRSGWGFRATGGTMIAYIALVYFVIIMLGNGFSGFTKGNWSTPDFVCNYIGIPIYLACFLGWKLVKRTKFVNPREMDLITGKAAIDREELTYVAPVARNFAEKVWNAIC
jgi:amino acid transporter